MCYFLCWVPKAQLLESRVQGEQIMPSFWLYTWSGVSRTGVRLQFCWIPKTLQHSSVPFMIDTEAQRG